MRVIFLIVAAAAVALTGCASAKRVAGVEEPPPRCADIAFPIYFASGSTALTGPAQQAIRMAAQSSRGCKGASVEVTGLADAVGPAEQAEALSRDRAQAVAQALAAQGFPAPIVQSGGADGARTPAGAVVPARRRAEVVIRFIP
jgi:outer membrane protein OmpA-like peptidoglycan-associated protein